MLIPSFFSITERNNEKFEIFHQNVWSIQKYLLYLPRQKVAFGYPGRIPREGKALSILPILLLPKVFFDYPGKFPAREQDLIDTTPRKRVSIFMMLTYFFCYYSLPEK